MRQEAFFKVSARFLSQLVHTKTSQVTIPTLYSKPRTCKSFRALLAPFATLAKPFVFSCRSKQKRNDYYIPFIVVRKHIHIKSLEFLEHVLIVFSRHRKHVARWPAHHHLDMYRLAAGRHAAFVEEMHMLVSHAWAFFLGVMRAQVQVCKQYSRVVFSLSIFSKRPCRRGFDSGMRERSE